MTRAHALALATSLLFSAACSRSSPPTPRYDAPAHAGIDRATVRAELALHRTQQIERLGSYAQGAQFPHNYGKAMPTHVFRDSAGRLCAVANLVHQDSRDDLVDRTAREHNDLAIADVHDGPMLDWMLSSGLTQEELVRIQLPAPPLARQHAVPVAVPVDETRMNIAVVLHVDQLVRELLADRDKSLDIATDRLLASRTLAARARPSRLPAFL
jgi:hypothetical protein